MAKLYSPYRIIIAFVIILILIGVAVKTLFFFPNAAYRNFMQQIPNWSYPRSYCAGLIAAIRDWESDQAVINIFGHTGGLIQDRKTGLTILTFGGASRADLDGFCDGYNRVIDTYIRWFGIPTNSRKVYENILLDPVEYFDNMLKTATPMTIILDGNAIRLPNRASKISLTSVRNNNNKLIDYQLSWDTKSCWTWPLEPVDNTLSLFAGPTESDFLIIRGRNDAWDCPWTFVLDLRYGYWIELSREP